MHKLLIVEDERELAEALARTMRREYTVAVAGDAQSARAELGTFRPDLVLLDIILPSGTGLHVLEAAAAAADGPRVLVMSGSVPDLDLSRFSHVVAGVLTKPFKLAEARRRVQEALAHPPAPAPVRTGGVQGAVLLVDDDPDVADQIKSALTGRGYQVVTAGSVDGALAQVRRRRFDVVVSDWILPGKSGTDLLQELGQVAPGLPVILLSGYATRDFTRRALSLGAADVLPKPLPPKALYLAVEKCLLRTRRVVPTAAGARGAALPVSAPGLPGVAPPRTPRPTRAARTGAAGHHGTRYGPDDILGTSPGMARLRDSLHQVAGLHSTVLITGETGVGKELLAQSLHQLSPRAAGPFVALNAGAIPESLLESELFGYGSGAFTGAKREGHPGKFEQADGGTLFLDEIGDLPLGLQGKLLRVLEEGEVDPVGGSGPRSIDVRVVAATHRDLAEMVRVGRFRSDLYYRLNVVHLTVPALRARPGDIPLLVAHFLVQLAAAYGGPERTLDPAALALLQAYAWPGNVRELRNVLEHAFAFAPDAMIGVEHLPESLRMASAPIAGGGGAGGGAGGSAATSGAAGGGAAADGGGARGGAAAAERAALLEALAVAGGNKVRAARVLGVSRATLYVKLKVHGLV